MSHSVIRVLYDIHTVLVISQCVVRDIIILLLCNIKLFIIIFMFIPLDVYILLLLLNYL
jgi:multidrug efflux pump subunit AcrB